MLGEREASDLRRAQGHLDALTVRFEDAAYVNILDVLFGEYRCQICPSYGHDTSVHKREQGVPLADRGAEA